MADDPVSELYGLPLNEFVPARDALARELRKGDDKERAAEVAKLKRPSVAAWAVNQLARRNRKELDLLLDAGHRLRAGQLEALGSGDRAKFEKARADHERAVRDLTAAAREILAEERGSTSDQMLSSIERTLRYASLDDEERAALASGRLANEVEATGFDAFAGMALPSAPPAPARPAKQEARSKATRATRGDDARRRRERIAEAQEALKLAREREREARQRLRDAEREERAAAKALERAAAETAAAREALEDAAAETQKAAERVDAERAP